MWPSMPTARVRRPAHTRTYLRCRPTVQRRSATRAGHAKGPHPDRVGALSRGASAPVATVRRREQLDPLLVVRGDVVDPRGHDDLLVFGQPGDGGDSLNDLKC
jgi:hypothetical protein